MASQEVRNRLLKRAVLTSLTGKGVSVITQLVAVPLAIKALGLERYGAYAMLAAVFLWSNAATSAVSSALSLQLVTAHAEGDRTREAALFSTAFCFALSLSLLMAMLFQFMIRWVDIQSLFGLKSATHVNELRAAANWMAVLIPANVLLSLSESAHTGYQRQYVNNLLLTAANVFTILGLLLVVQTTPTIQSMVLALFLPAALSRVVNMGLLWYSRPHLVPRPALADAGLLRRLLAMGAAFAVTQIGTFCYQQFPVFFVGRVVGLTEAAYMSTMMLVIAISGSVLQIFTQPLVPALRDAASRGDRAWTARVHNRSLRRLVPYISLASIGIALFGSFFVATLTRQPASLTWLVQVLWGAYFWIVAWEHVGYTFVVGLGQVWRAAILFVAGGLLCLLSSLLMVPLAGLAGTFAAMCLGPLVFTVVAYPVLIRRQVVGAATGASPHP